MSLRETARVINQLRSSMHRYLGTVQILEDRQTNKQTSQEDAASATQMVGQESPKYLVCQASALPKNLHPPRRSPSVMLGTDHLPPTGLSQEDARPAGKRKVQKCMAADALHVMRPGSIPPPKAGKRNIGCLSPAE